MKVANTFVFNERRDLKDQIRMLQLQLSKIFLLAQGNIRFGTGADGVKGENISGIFQEFTTSGTPDAENTIAHGLGAIPVGYIIMGQDKAGSLYQLDDTGTAWDTTNIYLKCDIASVTFKVFITK